MPDLNPLDGITVLTADEEQSELHNKVWYLQQSQLFTDVSQDRIAGVQEIFHMKQHPRRALIFDLGDTERTIFIVKTGKVRLARLTPEGKEITLAVLGPGDVFGEAMLFEQSVRSTIAVVVEDALLCTAKAEDLFALLTQDAHVAVNVARLLSGRLDNASATMEDLAYAKLPDRLMNVFERLAREHGVREPDGIAIDVRLTHAEIASLVGSTRESVGVEMQALIRDGRLRMRNRVILLPDA